MRDAPPFSIVRKFISDPTTGETKVETSVELTPEFVTTGLMKALGPFNIESLINLALRMNENGECHASLEQLAEGLGISVPKASLRYKKLCEFQWNHQPLVLKTWDRDPLTRSVTGTFYQLNFRVREQVTREIPVTPSLDDDELPGIPENLIANDGNEVNKYELATDGKQAVATGKNLFSGTVNDVESKDLINQDGNHAQGLANSSEKADCQNGQTSILKNRYRSVLEAIKNKNNTPQSPQLGDLTSSGSEKGIEEGVHQAPSPVANNQAESRSIRTEEPITAHSDPVSPDTKTSTTSTEERETKRNRAKKGKAATDERVKAFIDEYFTLYRGKYGVSPKEKPAMMAKRIFDLPSDFTKELLLSAIREYMASEEFYVCRNSHAFNIFLNRLPSIISEIQKKSQEPSGSPAPNPTQSSTPSAWELMELRKRELGLSDDDVAQNRMMVDDILSKFQRIEG